MVYSSTGTLDCEVTIVGGGISGLYMAYMLLKTKKESQVCVFEKDPNLGGRIRDYHFKQAPAVDVGKEQNTGLARLRASDEFFVGASCSGCKGGSAFYFY